MSDEVVPIEELWTVADVARFVKASKSWVYKAAEVGAIPGTVRLGAMVRFRPEIVRAWVEGRVNVEVRAVKLPGCRG